ncbi:MAG: hypothetical protein ACRDCQ_20430 [Aeromonas sobria]|uniref:hypothetical protein n=1 Tax=Aeromonas sobria TaxID=646 RepID=UPI003F3D3E6E
MTVHMGWRELRHGFDRQLSFAQQSVGQLPGCVARIRVRRAVATGGGASSGRQ